MDTDELMAAAEAAGLTPANFRKMSKERRAKWVKSRQAELTEALPKPSEAEAPKASTGPSRQVRRQMERRSKKMPIGMSAAKWHRINNMATVKQRQKVVTAKSASARPMASGLMAGLMKKVFG